MKGVEKRDTETHGKRKKTSRFGIWWSVGLPYLEHYYHYILLV